MVSAALVLSAPFIGFVRSWIRATFPGQFARIIGGLLGVAALLALGAAAARIGRRRLPRYIAIVAALIFAAWYSLSHATGVPEVDAVQRFHFVEYGAIAFLFYRAWRPLDDPAIFILPVLAGLIVGTADEWLQWFIPNRIGEMDDIFLNGIAIGCGLLFSLGADPPSAFSPALRAGSLKRIGRMAAALVIALTAFFHAVHLGYDVADDEVGLFKSRYSKPTLEAIAAQKLEQWRTHPPPLVLRRVSREDQYMTEGATHVQERNEQFAADDVAAAWRENRILEKYYAPVLDTPSYLSATGHRWSADQRNDAASRVAGFAPAPYVSAANPYPIYAWSRTLLWGTALAIAISILTLFSMLDRDSAPKL